MLARQQRLQYKCYIEWQMLSLFLIQNPGSSSAVLLKRHLRYLPISLFIRDCIFIFVLCSDSSPSSSHLLIRPSKSISGLSWTLCCDSQSIRLLSTRTKSRGLSFAACTANALQQLIVFFLGKMCTFFLAIQNWGNGMSGGTPEGCKNVIKSFDGPSRQLSDDTKAGNVVQVLNCKNE